MDWIAQRESDAVAKIRAELEKPMPVGDQFLDIDHFDPWELFPCLYGTYSKAFDDMALVVLRNLQLAADDRWDDRLPEELAHEMFREILCRSDLCEYGTSPRVCFATQPFRAVLPELIDKWEAFSRVHWAA